MLRVDLIHFTQQHGQFYVAAKLIEMEYADDTEESFLSKVWKKIVFLLYRIV